MSISCRYLNCTDNRLLATQSFVWLEPYLFLLSWQNLVMDRDENGFSYKSGQVYYNINEGFTLWNFHKSKIKVHLFKCVVVKVLLIKEFSLTASKFSSTLIYLYVEYLYYHLYVRYHQLRSTLVDKQTVNMDIKIMLICPLQQLIDPKNIFRP